MNIKQFWLAILRQDADAIRTYFHPDAWVNWHNTNEHFNVTEFIQANCEYPGDWDGKVTKVFHSEDNIITVTNVYTKDHSMSFHVTSFIKMKQGKIVSIDEYWGDDGEAPPWRQDKHIGKKIK